MTGTCLLEKGGYGHEEKMEDSSCVDFLVYLYYLEKYKKVRCSY